MATMYQVLRGPEHFLPPAAASMGIRLPDPGQAHIHGKIVNEDEAMEVAARQFLSAKVPTIFPVRLSCGPGMKKRPERPRRSGIYMKRLRHA